MTKIIKKSFRNKEDKKETSKKDGYASEFGAIIKNDPDNYPDTSNWKQQYPVVTDKCDGIGLCAKHCPDGAIQIRTVNGKKRAFIDMRFCKGEGMCATVCPKKAIKMVKKK